MRSGVMVGSPVRVRLVTRSALSTGLDPRRQMVARVHGVVCVPRGVAVSWHLVLCLRCGGRRISLACFLTLLGCAVPRPVRSLLVPSSTRGSRPCIYWAAARGTWRLAGNWAPGACGQPSVRHSAEVTQNTCDFSKTRSPFFLKLL